jgi:hypothetical protein
VQVFLALLEGVFIIIVHSDALHTAIVLFSTQSIVEYGSNTHVEHTKGNEESSFVGIYKSFEA